MTVRSSFLVDHDKQIMTVDVICGEGNGVNIGDWVEMEYQEYLIEAGPSYMVKLMAFHVTFIMFHYDFT